MPRRNALVLTKKIVEFATQPTLAMVWVAMTSLEVPIVERDAAAIALLLWAFERAIGDSFLHVLQSCSLGFLCDFIEFFTV